MSVEQVAYELDESGHWIVSVPDVQGCHSYGRSINEARTRIREALGLFVRGAAKARFEDDVKLPADARRALDRASEARERAEAEQARASARTREAVRRLTKGLNLSVRDTGELVGISHQRVQPLISEARCRGAIRGDHRRG